MAVQVHQPGQDQALMGPALLGTVSRGVSGGPGPDDGARGDQEQGVGHHPLIQDRATAQGEIDAMGDRGHGGLLGMRGQNRRDSMSSMPRRAAESRVTQSMPRSPARTRACGLSIWAAKMPRTGASSGSRLSSSG